MTFCNILAAVTAIVGGILLLAAGVTGGTGVWGFILNLIITHIGGETAIIAAYTLNVLTILANLGGVTVIIGVVLFYVGRITIGRFLSSIGAGIGVIGFIILYAVSIVYGWTYLITITANLLTTISGIGILLTIIASATAEKQ